MSPYFQVRSAVRCRACDAPVEHIFLNLVLPVRLPHPSASELLAAADSPTDVPSFNTFLLRIRAVVCPRCDR